MRSSRPAAHASGAVAARSGATKVPQVTGAFWIAKALTTAMGESTSDFLVHTIAPTVAVALGAVAFALAMAWQFRTDRYLPWVYWTAVAMVGIFGTMCADVLHVGLGVPYTASTVLFGIILAAVFGLWYRYEGTLSVHTITTPRREFFYWAAVVSTFALGTAAGDLTAVTFGLGYLSSAILFGAVILIPALGRLAVRLNSVLAFWFAYILTRPLGASIADWLAVSTKRGGLDLGPGPVSLGLAVIIAAMVGYLTLAWRRADSPA